MKADERFIKQPKNFWAYVRTISQQVGYTNRLSKQIKVPTLSEIDLALQKLNLDPSQIIIDGEPTDFGQTLLSYFEYRAHLLNNFVEPRLMDGQKAKVIYDKLSKKFKGSLSVPMNKQSGDKKNPAYFTAIINMLISQSSDGLRFDSDPRTLTTVTLNNVPLRTLARRFDGAFPSAVNPIAVWEIKEYYYTTTFGSRVADGVYESLLDGMELEELREHEGIDVKHYLMIDGHYTWWECGRSYLCRLIDMLHMQYVDEIFFGLEVTEHLPDLVKDWVELSNNSEKDE